ncbi:MAG: nuclear transport factor 2 family protein [Acidimicrobiales bacterium]|nr:nuclear transport factor 2 family protein [Acidimicrobiales bacterium]
MSPRDEVLDLLGRYCEAVLRFDLVAFRDCWAQDAVWVLPGDQPNVEGPDACVELFGRLRGTFALCTQEILSSVVEVAPDGRSADVRSVIREAQWMPEGPGRLLVGIYHDAVVADDAGRWRFRRRRFEAWFRGAPDLTGRIYDR